MKILAIETSCDETAIALLKASGNLKSPKFEIIKNLVSSQTKIHAHWGGVVPNLAKREHLKNLPIILKKLMPRTINLKPDILAVTVGPGLEPALWTGINFAKEIKKNLFPKIKLIGANHLEGHLYSFLLSPEWQKIKNKKNVFPAIALIVSGGHTIILKMDSITKHKKIGETRDDAVGEAYDKVARMLKLPYPGGPEIEKLAKSGDPNAINFPRPMINSKDFDFSYSGLKTSVLYYLRDNKNYKKEDVAASFQASAIGVLLTKTMRAAKKFGAKSIMLSGGVASNKSLRKGLRVMSRKLKVNFLPSPMKFNTDNATMIAVAGYINHLQKKNRKITAQGNLSL